MASIATTARRAALAGLLALFSVAAQGAEGAPGALLERFIDEVRTFEADFEQQLLDKEGRAIEKWSGRFWMQRPGKFRWRYEKPYVQEIIGDGERIYQYDAELAQLIIDHQGELLATAPTRFLFDRPALEQFEIHEFGTLGDLKLVQLRDRRRDTSYEEFLIAFRDGIVATVEMRDSFDQVTRINYSRVRVNHKIPPARLRLPELPEGVDRLDRTAPDEVPEGLAPPAD